MAANKTKTVTVDGIEVRVDLAYTQSWDGIRKAARAQSGELAEEQRVVCVMEYYERAIANLDEVSEALGDKPASDVVALLGKAITEATPKN